MKKQNHKTLTKFILLSLIAVQFVACAKGNLGDQLASLPGDESTLGQEPQDGNNNGETTSPETPSTEAPVVENGFRLDQEVKKYKDRYELENTFAKLTDNKGQGVDELYGTRNFRVVLHGVMYRGGANNKYLSTPRSNVNPLPTVGLNNLCKEDFSAAVYLYSENFNTAPKSVSCKDTSHQDHKLNYKQYAAAGEKEKILQMVYDRIKGKLDGPIYAHCWNGWHSSGLISGIVLKQFCGWSNEKADAYWMKNTDGNNKGFDSIRRRLREFKPLVKYSITAAERALICPQE
ncbi:hypothetical protein QJS83_04705 [Bdellovibrio sp. 22V]|uniref:hypothetical protein n=1 Tax=Bdellovibrio TaxID=958 RepID=UPI00254383C7|nr:hypothetical protein [Bdellovibrio sp. 22V]WII73172.1 hypothetical protein QJS83_04705 [Bdellovibrio sp. 22V]